MKDILGREIKDGDLCVVMKCGRHTNGMQHYVKHGKSFWGLDSYGKLVNHSVANTYLVTNPTEEELLIKNEINAAIDEKVNAKPLKGSDQVRGGVYATYSERKFLYLGKCEIVNTFGETLVGHTYVVCPVKTYGLEDSIKYGTYDVLANKKKLHHSLGMSNIPEAGSIISVYNERTKRTATCKFL